MQAGDYIGPWIFTQLRDGLKLLTATTTNADTFTPGQGGGGQSPTNYFFGTIADDNPSSFAQAVGRAQGRFSSANGGGIYTGPAHASSGVSSRNDNLNPPVQYTCSLQSNFPAPRVYALGTTATKTLRLWVIANPTATAFGYPTWAFDAAGFNVALGAWTVLQSAALDAATTSYNFPNLSSMPPVVADPGVPDTNGGFRQNWPGFELWITWYVVAE